jgi:hypothetical protein
VATSSYGALHLVAASRARALIRSLTIVFTTLALIAGIIATPSVIPDAGASAAAVAAPTVPKAIATPWAIPAGPLVVDAGSPSPATPTPEPARRPGFDAPLDPLFPSTDFGGPLIGVNVDPVGFPLEKTLAGESDFGKLLDKNRVRVYGWVDGGAEFSNSSSLNTFPISYNDVPNRIELDQAVIRLERDPDTVQQDHVDYGFRIDNIYGLDYRFTTAYGYQSQQLTTKNLLNGYDNPELYGMIYVPHMFAGGSVIQVGRVISIPDIEAQLAPQNYIYSHSIMFTEDSYTQTGVLIWSKLSNMFTIDYGIDFGDDVEPGSAVQRFPTGQFFVKYTTKANKDDILVGVDAYNNRPFAYTIVGSAPQTKAQCANENGDQYALANGTIETFKTNGSTCLAGHDNLQQQNLTWFHVFSPEFHNAFEAYYLQTRNAPVGGSIINGPLQYAAGGGPGALIHGRADATGFVDYLEDKVSPTDFLSFRSDYLNDPQGWRTGYATSYGSLTLSLSHHFSALTWLRPELRIEKNFARGVNAYDNLESASGFAGTKNYQRTLGVDLIQWF